MNDKQKMVLRMAVVGALAAIVYYIIEHHAKKIFGA